MGSHPARSRQLFGEFRAGARFCTVLDKVLEMVPEFRRSSRKKKGFVFFFAGRFRKALNQAPQSKRSAQRRFCSPRTANHIAMDSMLIALVLAGFESKIIGLLLEDCNQRFEIPGFFWMFPCLAAGERYQQKTVTCRKVHLPFRSQWGGSFPVEDGGCNV